MEEAVGVVRPERRVAVMGHGGAEDTRFRRKCNGTSPVSVA
jgi:hypothetical protein